MSGLSTRTKVLITVLTYPHPSEKYKELICIAGITESGHWVRLYPNPHRYQAVKIHKYQWIEVALTPGGQNNDQRKESHKPDLSTLKICGDPIKPDHNWRERRRLIVVPN